jgi:hypothetical protein
VVVPAEVGFSVVDEGTSEDVDPGLLAATDESDANAELEGVLDALGLPRPSDIEIEIETEGPLA